MEAVFHEKQEGSLCAQHCLNSLLQGAYFNPVDLSSLALSLDEAERIRMAECGEESDEYQRFLRQPSGNMDDSGFFSVQVISSALEVWGLELVPFSSADERVTSVFSNPCKMQAFICNYKEHWFTIRKLGNQWFNLNSLLNKPQLISDTYLALFLAQLKNDGYSIFVIFGVLPDCDADHLLKLKPAIQINSDIQEQDDTHLQEALQQSLHESKDCEEHELIKAIQMSMQSNTEEDDDVLLRKAIHMSLDC
ncbi:PREDICTED: ataxin-3-like [Nicrophorus vespilloides]|uniref:ubiquitinyl hydrolase 1 n=1 Tax=Nicrophorus vespilloides TaxID=110193 RepID=A0ABM1MFT1_NICVS|nr:PREDICTED: ataxin-3-like [Nicrophorus vespilloides]